MRITIAGRRRRQRRFPATLRHWAWWSLLYAGLGVTFLVTGSWYAVAVMLAAALAVAAGRGSS